MNGYRFMVWGYCRVCGVNRPATECVKFAKSRPPGSSSRHARPQPRPLPLLPSIANRPVYDWPGGKGLAVYLGLNLETFSFGEGLGAKLVPALGEPDVLNYAWRDCGNRVGAWRLLDCSRKPRFPASVLVNSALYDEAPELMAAFRARGDEIVGHGRTNSERQGAFGEEAEAAHDRRSHPAHRRGGRHARRAAGSAPGSRSQRVTARPAGARPATSTASTGRWTTSLYSCAPRRPPAALGALSAGAQRYSRDCRAPGERRGVRRAIIAAFDEMLEQSRQAPLVMGIALHPYIVGQPHRLRPLRRALKHIAARRDEIWITTAGAIAAHALALPQGTVP